MRVLDTALARLNEADRRMQQEQPDAWFMGPGSPEYQEALAAYLEEIDAEQDGGDE